MIEKNSTVVSLPFVRRHVTAWVAAAAVLPILVISFLGSHYAHLLHAVVPIDLTNWMVTRRVFSALLHPARTGDSWLPMQHALAVLQGPDRGRLYETLFFGSHERFQYPPSSLLALDLFSHLGLLKIRALNGLNSLFFLLNAAGMGWFAWLLFRGDRVALRRRAGAMLPSAAGMSLLAAAVPFLFYPLTRALVLGQIQLWIDLLFTGALLLWLMERRLPAGVLIGIACTIKPQLGLLLVWGLLWREFRFAAGILIACLPIGALSLLLYGVHNHVAYLGVLSFLSRHGESFFANNSVNGILNWYLSPDNCLYWNHGVFTPYIPAVHVGTLVTTLIFFTVIIVPPLLFRRRRAELADLAVAAICTVVSSPVAWEHHYGILLPLFLVALWQVLTWPGRAHCSLSIAVLSISWILVADFIPFASLLVHTPFVFAQAYCFFGALLLLLLFLAELRSLPAAASGAVVVAGELSNPVFTGVRMGSAS